MFVFEKGLMDNGDAEERESEEREMFEKDNFLHVIAYKKHSTWHNIVYVMLFIFVIPLLPFYLFGSYVFVL